jgi:hypothetical protein
MEPSPNERASRTAEEPLTKLAAQLEAGKSEMLKDYISVMARFRRYSWSNSTDRRSTTSGDTCRSRPRKFRERLEGWLDLVRALWPECPAKVDENGTGLWVDRANAVLTQEVANARRG